MPSITWLTAAGMTIREWHCPGAERPLSDEETPGAYEVSVVRTGAYLRCLEDRTVAADPATLVCGNQAEPFRLAQTVGVPARETVVSLHEPGFRELLGEVDPRASEASVTRFPVDALILAGSGALIHAALLRARVEGGDPVALQELAIGLARWALRPHAGKRRPAQPLSGRAIDAVQHTRATLAIRYFERLTLDELARAVGLTPWHLSRVFRAASGESIHQHLMRVRLHAALERVALQERNLTRIALECGFSSHSHFTSAFRNAFGNPPSRALG